MKQYSFRIFYRMILLIVGCAFIFSTKADDEVQNVRVLRGTLEPAVPPQSGYFFRHAGGEVFYDAARGFFPGRGVDGMPDLAKIGIKLDNGKKYFYRDAKNESELLKRVVTENPTSQAIAFVYEDRGHNLLELLFKGPTPVYRINLTVGEREMTIWTNREKDAP